MITRTPRAGIAEMLGDALTSHQRQAALKLISSRLSILGGGPGTGKTFTIAQIIKGICDLWGESSIVVGAPTGKAAVRVKQALAAYEIRGVRVATWHSILEPAGSMSEFVKGINDPLDYRWVIGDESSMISCDLMSAILKASITAYRVLLVGDVNQLSPVGHGAPLRDMIAGGVPYAELTEVKRNSGRIVQACHAIRQGLSWDVSSEPDPARGENLELLVGTSPSGQLSIAIDKIKQAKQSGFDPVWDCQLIVPVNEKSPLGREKINQVLQSEFNPSGERITKTELRVGDKVINTKNANFKTSDGTKEARVANGEMGKVVDHDESRMIIELQASIDDDPRSIVVYKSSGTDEESGRFQLGYAISGHKSQGSEWPIVAVMLDEHAGAKMVLDRAWIYTAISRAKYHCYLVGKMQTAWNACARNRMDKRKTFLADLIKRNGENK